MSMNESGISQKKILFGEDMCLGWGCMRTAPSNLAIALVASRAR